MRTGRPLAPLTLSAQEYEQLTAWSRGHKVSRAVTLRSRIILGCARHLPNSEIARRLHISQQTVGKWRSRFLERRLDGLLDHPRPGAPRKLDAARVKRLIATTLEKRPGKRVHWSTRSLARELGLSQSTVSRTWRALGLQPHRAETFELATDPRFVSKVRGIAGLYMNPPLNALVLGVDENSALETRATRRLDRPGARSPSARRPHDRGRPATTSVLAALKIATADAIGRPQERPRAGAFLQFLRTIHATVPDALNPHVIVDHEGARKTPSVAAWLARHPRMRLHVMPTPPLWLAQAERWFTVLSEVQNRPGPSPSSIELHRAIRRHLDRRHRRPRPFIWTGRLASTPLRAARSARPATGSKRGA